MYEVFRTKDGLPIGVKLLVVYEIQDPERTLIRLKQEQIVSHIENLVVADMGAVVQQCSSSDFQSTDQTKTRAPMKTADTKDGRPSAPEFIRYLQDEVKNKLYEDFKELEEHIKEMKNLLIKEVPNVLLQNLPSTVNHILVNPIEICTFKY